ncbi:MAG: type II toxin-antitoxin system HipA family toxin [Ignavibacteriaceae bacterium]
MNTIAKVNIWNEMVGAVVWDESKDYATFEFEESFIKKDIDIAPLRMPIAEAKNGKRIFSFPNLNKETYKGLPGMLADSLPDRFGNRLIDVWLAQQGRSSDSFNPVERLCYIGKRGMGALEFEPILTPFDQSSTQLELSELVKLAKNILDERYNFKTHLSKKNESSLLDILRIGTSAGGARAKAIIAYNTKTKDVRSGQIDNLDNYEYWIIKFDGVSDKKLGDPQGYGRIEYAYYLMAKECGVKMNECKILFEDKHAHFMTKRFDRIDNNKLHMQTLCAIAHYDYNYPSSYSYEQAFQVIRQLKLSYENTEQLFLRMVFNVIARNQDDHTKNISFLMDKNGKWSLAPAYDVTFAYDPKNKWMKSHQMSINGKFDDIDRNDIITLAKNMNIKKASQKIDTIIDVVARWKDFAKEAKVTAEQIKLIQSTLLLKI